MLRTASTIEDYTKYLKYLYFLLDSIRLLATDEMPEPKHPFLQYFMKNWNQQKERWDLETRSRQSDISSCGVMVLMFFECFTRGIDMPRIPTPAAVRLLRLRYLLKCIS
ncbi:Hypothetical protein PHPALM_36662 [Phytophthora palmivora]|uniref:Ubiquitin-like protease family profile domain-containing protein n=1 Tax=Phytophthora palmivora TaxID=4796 RepID=A0A2P4WZE3_9STRA|nr:Hypothetical protein PHPALM_36662 [Phytophthora palmivora]